MALSFTYQGKIVIVLDEENLERMQQHDPFEFNQRQVPTPTAISIPLQIVIAYANRDEYLKILGMTEFPDAVMQYLFRGYKETDTDRQRQGGYKPL